MTDSEPAVILNRSRNFSNVIFARISVVVDHANDAIDMKFDVMIEFTQIINWKIGKPFRFSVNAATHQTRPSNKVI